MKLTKQKITPESKLESMILILKTPQFSRTKRQIHELSSFLSQFSYFTKNQVAEDLMFKICECVTYEYYSENDYICKIGEKGTEFYIILQGSVRVLVSRHQDDIEYEANQLTDGMEFGEYSLLNNSARLASIQCITNTHVLVLSKENYSNLLGKIDHKRFDEIVHFFRSFNIFKN